MRLQGDFSSVTAPGQFVNFAVDGCYLRRPISVCDVEDNVLTVIYKTVGKGTEIMSGMPVGKKSTSFRDWETALTFPRAAKSRF